MADTPFAAGKVYILSDGTQMPIGGMTLSQVQSAVAQKEAVLHPTTTPGAGRVDAGNAPGVLGSPTLQHAGTATADYLSTLQLPDWAMKALGLGVNAATGFRMIQPAADVIAQAGARNVRNAVASAARPENWATTGGAIGGAAGLPFGLEVPGAFVGGTAGAGLAGKSGTDAITAGGEQALTQGALPLAARAVPWLGRAMGKMALGSIPDDLLRQVTLPPEALPATLRAGPIADAALLPLKRDYLTDQIIGAAPSPTAQAGNIGTRATMENAVADNQGLIRARDAAVAAAPDAPISTGLIQPKLDALFAKLSLVPPDEQAAKTAATNLLNPGSSTGARGSQTLVDATRGMSPQQADAFRAANPDIFGSEDPIAALKNDTISMSDMNDALQALSRRGGNWGGAPGSDSPADAAIKAMRGGARAGVASAAATNPAVAPFDKALTDIHNQIPITSALANAYDQPMRTGFSFRNMAYRSGIQPAVGALAPTLGSVSPFLRAAAANPFLAQVPPNAFRLAQLLAASDQSNQ